MTLAELTGLCEAQTEATVRLRRRLHRIPEEGFREFKTQKVLCERLEALGIPFTCARTWVVAELRGAQSGPLIALRADMDALPIEEPEDCPFRSEHPGWMHACGHDAHMAIQLGAAAVLSGLRNQLRGGVRLLFQPAEETVGGALPMVEAGAMAGVDRVYGLHVQPYMTVGSIDTRPGCLNASTDEFEIVVHGVAGHAARPEQGVDAVVCAAQIVVQLQTLVSRQTSPLTPAVLSIGAIAGGRAANVICDEVRMRGTLRTADPELRTRLISALKRACAGIAEACGARVEVRMQAGYAPLINNSGEVDRVLRLGRALLGPEGASVRPSPSMGGEDFSFFSRCAPGAFWHLGCAREAGAAPLHSPNLFVDERCLPIGVTLQCALVLDAMGLLEA